MDRVVFRAGPPGGKLGLTAWETLRSYQSEGLLKYRLQKSGEQNPSAARIDDIIAHIRQAENYFSSALSSDLIIRPLILYYGCLSLTRAAILILSIGKTVETLKSSHGMGMTVEDPRSGSPENLVVKLWQRGTFSQFVEVTKNTTKMRNFMSDGVVASWIHRPVSVPTSVTLEEILCRLPDLSQQNVRRGADLAIARIRKIEAKDNNFLTVWFFDPGVDYAPPVSDIVSWFNLDDQKILSISSNSSISGSMADIAWPAVWHLHQGRSGGSGFDGDCLYMIRPFNRGVDLSKSAVTLMLAFALSSCARYYPAMWRAILDGRSGNATPTIISSLRYIQDRFPEMIVDIVDEDFVV